MEEKITYDRIKPYIEKKLVFEQSHPENADIKIFNYTQHCQFDGAWDDVTKQCRGLIMNVKTGEILARPFPKFFNYQEHIEKKWPVPVEKHVIYPKFDGSLGILYWLNGKPYVATRGSFGSEQAKWAMEYIKSPSVNEWIEDLRDDGHTHLFEIIYPENKIVVAYSFSGLIHLASVEIATGKSKAPDSYFPLASKLDDASFEELLKMNPENEEGYVIHFPESDVRMKIKFPEYVRLHKVITGLSAIGIWESLLKNEPMDEMLKEMPDEFFKWFTSVRDDLKKKFDAIATQAALDFSTIMADFDSNDFVAERASLRKHFAIKAQETKYPGILFSMLDEKPWMEIAWKAIRPRGQSVYKVDIDS